MQFTAKPATTILVYNYRADLSKPVRKDGTPQPWLEDGGSIPGKNSAVVTAYAWRTTRTAGMISRPW